MAGTDGWRKAPAENVARFHEAVAAIDGVEVRNMFGFPAAFIGGNLTAGLHQESVIGSTGAAAHVRTLPPKAPKTPKSR